MRVRLRRREQVEDCFEVHFNKPMLSELVPDYFIIISFCVNLFIPNALVRKLNLSNFKMKNFIF